MAEEAVADIRVRAEVKRAKRKRAEDETSAKVEAEIKEKAEKTREARKERANVEGETTERERAWAKSKAREKAEIARLSDEASDKNEFEARERKNANVVNGAAVEAAAKIRFSADI